MIKRIVNWMRKKRQLSGKGKAPSSSKNAVPAKIIPKQQHGINPDAFHKNAVQAVEKIRRGGYVAYIVGGAVRDLLLGVSPKDFDIATDATPAQVRRLFRNSRIIGRRFRIVHLYFHHDNEAKIMEVSTFAPVMIPCVKKAGGFCGIIILAMPPATLGGGIFASTLCFTTRTPAIYWIMSAAMPMSVAGGCA